MKSWPIFFGLVAIGAIVFACTRQGPRDVGNEHPRSEFSGAGTGSTYSASRPNGADAARDGGVIARPIMTGKKPREVARANARAIVTSTTHIYFGDAEDDALFALPKNANDSVRIARRAPIPGGLSFDGETLAWIASPGDTVFRLSPKNVGSGAQPSTVRDHGLFTDVAIAGGDVFITEAQNGSGAITRITGNTAARIAMIDGLPRGIAVDHEHVYIATSTKLAMTSRTRGEVIDLAKGGIFSNPHVDGHDVLATTTAAGAGSSSKRIVIRARKKTTLSGGETIVTDTVASNVRDAPIAVHKGTVYWFDADRPALLATSLSSPATTAPQTVSEDELFDRPNAICVDDDGIYIATGYGEGARVLVIR